MEKESTFACFDIEITQFAGSDVTIDKITLQLSSGSAEVVGVQLPQRCRPGEQLTIIYKLLAAAMSEKVDNVSPSRTLTITISGTVLISKDCTPKIKIKWKTALEIPRSRPNSRSAPSPSSTWWSAGKNVSLSPTAATDAAGELYVRALRLVC